MERSTQPNQADEALRQSAPSPDARAGLLAIADRLTNVRPSGDMYEARRLALALRQATDRQGFTPAADRLEMEILRHMPRLTSVTTRGEYALHLRKAAQS